MITTVLVLFETPDMVAARSELERDLIGIAYRTV